MHTVAHRFEELVVTVMNWCRIVSSTVVLGITHEAFTDLTYKLYTQVYKDSGMFSITPFALPLDRARAARTPPSVIQASQPPLLSTMPPKVMPQIVQREFADGSSVGSRPTSADILSRPASIASNRSYDQDQSLVIAQPVTGSQVCTVNPVKSKVVVDPGESIVLLRRYGKKIAAFKPNGTEEWYLVEDIRQTYFPRMTLDDFLLKYNDQQKKVLHPLTEEANLAFRHHYEMEDCEKFEVALMVHADALAELMKNR